MFSIRSPTSIFAVAIAASLLAAPTRAASESVVHPFQGGANDGAEPYAGLIYVNNMFYGTTEYGGTGACPLGCGTVFSMTSAGVVKLLHSFGSTPDGAYPVSGLIEVNGTLFGTTSAGGKYSVGTVFSIAPTGSNYKVLYSFEGVDGDGGAPYAGLVNVNGTLYGTTEGGGKKDAGTMFSITTSGTEKVLYPFQGGTKDGLSPVASLINVSGTLYGTTVYGGSSNYGTVFSLTTAGHRNWIYSFKGGTKDGEAPRASLIHVGGKLYGITELGGAKGGGTLFSVTTAGKETLVQSFGGSGIGINPVGSLISVSGTFYGTTVGGGTYSAGTVFKATNTSLSTLHSFSGGSSDGATPQAGLVNAGGTLYGTTTVGGGSGCHDFGCGTVFKVTPKTEKF